MAKASQRVDLGERLDITLTGAIKERLVEALGSGEAVELDGNQLKRIDTAGVQLLVAFGRGAGAGWRWRGGTPPGLVVETAARLGLDAELEAS